MPHFIKTGFWDKISKGFNGWLNLDDLITSLAGEGNFASLTGLPTDNPALQSDLAAKVSTSLTVAGVDLVDNITPTELNDALETRRLLYKKNISGSITGTTDETLINSFLIPAGTLGANDILHIVAMYTKVGGAGNWTVRMRVHTSSAVAGTVISTYVPASNILYAKTKREMMFKNSLSSQVIFNTTATGNLSDDAGVASAISALSLDFTIDQHMIATIQLGSAADTGTLQGWYVEIIRGS